MQPAAKKLRLVRSVIRSESFCSQYFDFQDAYKCLFALADGNQIETSLYVHSYRGKVVDVAVDIATMVGCPIGCQFCAATVGRYVRPLSADEMLAQFVQVTEGFDLPEYPKMIAAFQGIGEPSLLAVEVMSASSMIRSLDHRNVISISTTGAGLDGVRLWRTSSLPISVLQFSITATTESPQRYIIPRAPEFGLLLKEIALCSATYNIEVVNTNYVLLRDVNDSEEHVDSIAKYFSGTRVRFRVASLNTTAASNRFGLVQTSRPEAEEFAKRLCDRLVDASVFGAFNDTTVSCGQLTFQ